ncbi:MAG: hypothetical protein MJD61_10535 [Proteobacteria bacterium]|nr:hypothetical protein [Pseudomonadota bacterium]
MHEMRARGTLVYVSDPGQERALRAPGSPCKSPEATGGLQEFVLRSCERCGADASSVTQGTAARSTDGSRVDFVWTGAA